LNIKSLKMRKLVKLLFILFAPLLCMGQSHFDEQSFSHETSNELKGNAILLNSEKNRTAKNSGMNLLSFSVQPLTTEFSDEVMVLEIERIELEENNCIIQFNAPSYCGYSFLAEIQILDDTLNLIYQGYGSYSLGHCRYLFQYEVQKEHNENRLHLKYLMINGDLSTKTELSKKLVD